MIPTMIYPGDTVKIVDDAILTNTLGLIRAKKDIEIDESQKFLLNSSVIPKGTVLEVSQVSLKKRNSPENSITFKVVDGTMFPAYNKYLIEKERESLKSKIDFLNAKLNTFSEVSPVRQEISYEIKNIQKRLDSLSKKSIKKGFTKLLKISIQDVESWNLKVT